MAKVIRNNAVEEDQWNVIKEINAISELPAGKVIVPLNLWLAEKAVLKARGQFGVWLKSDQPPEVLVKDLADIEIIAIHFPAFTDGRGYSYARLLRERYSYKGEIRAIGDVLQDQLFFMKRCGIDSYEVRADKDIEKALSGLNAFSETYQAAVDQPVPLFRRRQ